MAGTSAEIREGDIVELDVVIVGGGLSGLSAAYHLHTTDPSLQVIVLEAKDRVGGRTVGKELKTANGTDWWDLGGQWVGCTQIHIMALLKKLGMEVYKQHISGKKVQQLGGYDVKTYSSDIPALNPLALLDLHLFMRRVEKMCDQVKAEDPSLCTQAEEWDSMTLADFIRQNMWTQGAVDAMKATGRCMFGTEPSQMSLLYFLMYANAAGGLEPLISANEGTGGQEYKVKGGAWQVSHNLLEAIGSDRVHLGEPVLLISQEQDTVLVKTVRQTYSCKRVIIATPPPQSGKIEYSPCLPIEKLLVFHNMPAAYITKVIVTYKTSFWRESGYSGEGVTNGGRSIFKTCETGPLCIIFDGTTSNNNPALVMFLGGKQHVYHAALTPEERKRAVLNSLAELYGNQAVNYINYAEKNWSEEPYNNGGPVCFGSPGMMRYIVPGLRHPFDRLHFAGTESATVWCGFLNGAVQAGYRAANEVLHNLRPQVITAADLEGTYYDQSTHRKRETKLKSCHVFRYTMGVSLCLIGIICFKKYYAHRIFHM